MYTVNTLWKILLNKFHTARRDRDLVPYSTTDFVWVVPLPYSKKNTASYISKNGIIRIFKNFYQKNLNPKEINQLFIFYQI